MKQVENPVLRKIGWPTPPTAMLAAIGRLLSFAKRTHYWMGLHGDQPRSFLEVAAYRVAAFLEEAAVLVFVFSLLDRALQHAGVTWRWFVATLGVAALFMGLGVVLEYLADRRFANPFDFEAGRDTL